MPTSEVGHGRTKGGERHLWERTTARPSRPENKTHDPYPYSRPPPGPGASRHRPEHRHRLHRRRQCRTGLVQPPERRSGHRRPGRLGPRLRDRRLHRLHPREHAEGHARVQGTLRRAGLGVAGHHRHAGHLEGSARQRHLLEPRGPERWPHQQRVRPRLGRVQPGDPHRGRRQRVRAATGQRRLEEAPHRRACHRHLRLHLGERGWQR